MGDYELLSKIKSSEDVKRLDEKDLAKLCSEIREKLIETVSLNGGHLSPNLGVVELTVALHRTFNLPKDSIVWDVGHQSYTHKLLTGRFDDFYTLRQKGGISGFPKRSESKYDDFNTGHSSTSISARTWRASPAGCQLRAGAGMAAERVTSWPRYPAL